MNVPTESVEQQTLFRWAKLNEKRHPELQLLFHIPNEGKRSYVTGNRMRSEGLKKGVPDLFLPIPKGRFHGLFIEMKRIKGGKISSEQKAWIRSLNAVGYKAVVAFGWEEASKDIEEYLALGSTKED